MADKVDEEKPEREARLRATFGACRVIVLADGSFELAGGSPDDRQEAEKWVAQLMAHNPSLRR